MTTILQISNSFNGILLDAYGVFWGGNAVGLLPGSKETMEKLVSSGKVVGILSNSTQLASKEINKFLEHGIIAGTHFHFLITSGDIARHLFLDEELPFQVTHNKFWVFGSPRPQFASHKALFQDTLYCETGDINEAAFIYIGVPHINGEDQTDPELFRQEIEKIAKANLPILCPNPDRFAHEGMPPRAVVRQGSIAALCEEMGSQVYYVGKPYKEAYTVAMQHFHQRGIFHLEEILMIGDTPETDIRGARDFGIASVLITHTGIMADRIAQYGLQQAMRKLPPTDQPDFFIGRFADDI